MLVDIMSREIDKLDNWIKFQKDIQNHTFAYKRLDTRLFEAFDCIYKILNSYDKRISRLEKAIYGNDNYDIESKI